MVKRTEVDEVVVHKRPALRAGEVHLVVIGERLAQRMPLDRLHIASLGTQLLGDDRREHLVEQQPQRRNAARPASHAPCASAASRSLRSTQSSISAVNAP